MLLFLTVFPICLVLCTARSLSRLDMARSTIISTPSHMYTQVQLYWPLFIISVKFYQIKPDPFIYRCKGAHKLLAKINTNSVLMNCTFWFNHICSEERSSILSWVLVKLKAYIVYTKIRISTEDRRYKTK